MSDLVWRSGFPPSYGWWPASINGSDTAHRWLDKDKQTWSRVAYPYYLAHEAAIEAAKIEDDVEIKWRARPDNWPERSKT